jgi:hypothetical protein
MDFQHLKTWSGTAEGVASEFSRLIKALGLHVEAPTVRTIRLWRTKKLFSHPAGSEFRGRQILEGLNTAILLKRGWSLAAIADLLRSLDDDALASHITGDGQGERGSQPTPAPVSLQVRRRRELQAMAEDAVALLAQGTLRQYARILTEREIVRQDDGLPPELQSAMNKIGRLYIEEGQIDRAACIHDLLDRARHPLASDAWGLAAFRDPEFCFAKVTLIDPDLRVPTSDCATIADISGGFGEDNVIEARLHTILRDSSERLGGRRRHEAYTALRELLARRSLIAERELRLYLDDRALTPLQDTIIEMFLHPVPDAWLIGGHALRCAHCGTLMRPAADTGSFPDGRCPIRQCHGKHPPRVFERLDPEADRLLVAHPQILSYWTGPGIDELRIYDEARRLGLEADLYPESDQCDVSVGGREIGIDAKSYSSPVSLAMRLNRSIGGLAHYRRRIVAVGDEIAADDPDYLSVLRDSLDKRTVSASLEVMSVRSVLAMLRSHRHA